MPAKGCLMNWIAWRMLTGDRAKYLAIVFGIAFSSLLIAQQCSIFCGVMRMTTGQIRDVEEASIWVLAPNVRYVEDLKPLADNDLYRVRGVAGVDWAVPLHKGMSRARLEDGRFQQLLMVGVDDATLVGAPQKMLVGTRDDLRQPDAVIIDEVGYNLLWPDEPYQVGRTLEMNQHRAVVVGVCQVSLTMQTLPLVYTRFSQAAHYLAPGQQMVTAILVQERSGEPRDDLCRRIEADTGLLALTREDFAWRTMEHYLKRTGLVLNFATTVGLGFLVGAAIAGQTFYTFTLENLRHFGTLKAMGVRNRRIVGMILLQAVVVAPIGYGLGVGAAAVFGELTTGHSKLVFYMPWQVLVGTGAAVVLVAMVASLFSIRRVLVLEPAMVFR
jgi:putative ABC transport system permease protein